MRCFVSLCQMADQYDTQQYNMYLSLVNWLLCSWIFLLKAVPNVSKFVIFFLNWCVIETIYFPTKPRNAYQTRPIKNPRSEVFSEGLDVKKRSKPTNKQCHVSRGQLDLGEGDKTPNVGSLIKYLSWGEASLGLISHRLLNITLTQQELNSLDENLELSDHLSFSQVCTVKFHSTKSSQLSHWNENWQQPRM